MKSKRLIGIVLTVMVLLSIPLIAMRFTDEVKWSAIDFITAGFLLLSTGLLCELILRKVKAQTYRFALCGAVLFGLAVVWVLLATSD